MSDEGYVITYRHQGKPWREWFLYGPEACERFGELCHTQRLAEFVTELTMCKGPMNAPS